MNRKTFAFVGGIVGIALFLAVGLLPSLVYGGYAGVVLSHAILGVRLDGQLFSKAVIVFGMLVGLLATSGVFTILGASMGAGLHFLVPAPLKNGIMRGEKAS